MPAWVYTIRLREEMDAEEFSGYFSVIDLEGIEEREKEVSVYLSDEQISEGESYIRQLCEEYGLDFSKDELENKNWNEVWEKSFQPVWIGENVLIRAAFHQANHKAKYEIVIEPKMSFGTGHHPTTFQVMECMQLISFENARVLDCGSGTGILAILAELQGAEEVIALDNDIWSFMNVKENMALNASEKIEPVMGELSEMGDTGFDIILANIHRNYLLQHMSLLSEKMVKKGKILMSGFYSGDAFVILEKALEHNLLANYYSVQHDWVCVVFEKH